MKRVLYSLTALILSFMLTTCSNEDQKGEVKVSDIKLNLTTLSLSVGDSETLNVTVLPDNATNKNVLWSSNNLNVATVNNTGLVTAVAPGTAAITVISESGNKLANCIIIATLEVSSVTLNKNSISLNIGATERLTATIEPTNASNKTITWSSSYPNVASVNSSGLVTAIEAGSTVVTVTTEDGNKTAMCSITVTTPTIAVRSVTLNKSSATLTIGATEQLTATINPTNATNKNVTWSSSSSSVATVNSSGLVTAVSTGSATIIVSTQDGGKIAICNVTVTN